MSTFPAFVWQGQLWGASCDCKRCENALKNLEYHCWLLYGADL